MYSLRFILINPPLENDVAVEESTDDVIPVLAVPVKQVRVVFLNTGGISKTVRISYSLH